MIKLITKELTYPLRQQILRPKSPIEDCHFDNDNNDNCFHLGLEINNKIICIASFYPEVSDLYSMSNQYRLRGMATAKNYQGQGFGGQLIKYALQELEKRKASLLWCNARSSAVNFYLKSGFDIQSEEFDIPTVGPHFVMTKKLSLT